MQLLLEMGVQIWKGRNDVIYGRKLEEKRQRAKEAALRAGCQQLPS